MPRIDDLNPKRSFKKKEYRPWDILGESTQLINEQIDNNKEAISKQLVTEQGNTKETVSNQLVNNKIQQKNKQETISNPISKQNDAKNSKQLVSQLVNAEQRYKTTLEAVKGLFGIQRKILFYIVEDCSSRGLLVSSLIQNETFRLLTNTDAHTVKTSIQRLVKKGFMVRERGKRGKGGYSSFTITEDVRNAVIEEQRQINNSKQLVNQLVNANSKQLANHWDTNKETIASSSGSDLYLNKNNNTTTNGYVSNQKLPDDWLAIDLEPLADIGFTKTHLSQIAQQNSLHSDEVQESIYAFAFDLKHNNRADSIKGSPLNFIMGILRKGYHYTPPGNYVSPRVEALRDFLERKKEEEVKIAQIEQELLENTFNEWLRTLDESTANQIVPPLLKGSTTKLAILKEHFKNNEWPVKKGQIFKEFS